MPGPMRRQIEALDHSLRSFIAQPNHPLLVLACSDADVLLPAKLLRGIEREERPELVLCFTAACPSAGAYVDELVGLLRLQLEAVQTEQRARGDAVWAELPRDAGDPCRPPAARLRAVIDWAAEVVADDYVIVWALLPHRIDDRNDYLSLVRPILPLAGCEAWMERHRIIVRDPVDEPCVGPLLREHQARDARVLTIDFSSARVLDSLVAEASDRCASTADRMRALSLLAAVDLAHARLDAARRKYELIHAHCDSTGDALGRALALHGLGDVALRSDDPSAALLRYRQSLELALREQQPGTLLTTLLGAGQAASRCGQDDDARHYFEAAEHLAGQQLNPGSKCDALLELGELHRRADEPDAARTTWTRALELARKFADDHRQTEAQARLACLDATEEQQAWT